MHGASEQCMQATEMRSPGTPSLSVTTRGAVDAPGDVVLGLAGGDAAVALDAALGVADELHSCHVMPPQAARST
jgi:hypothetical protein